jgi:hypothetical protein
MLKRSVEPYLQLEDSGAHSNAINSKLKFKSWCLFLQRQRRITLDETENRTYSLACTDISMFRRILIRSFSCRMTERMSEKKKSAFEVCEIVCT